MYVAILIFMEPSKLGIQELMVSVGSQERYSSTTNVISKRACFLGLSSCSEGKCFNRNSKKKLPHTKKKKLTDG